MLVISLRGVVSDARVARTSCCSRHNRPNLLHDSVTGQGSLIACSRRPAERRHPKTSVLEVSESPRLSALGVIAHLQAAAEGDAQTAASAASAAGCSPWLMAHVPLLLPPPRGAPPPWPPPCSTPAATRCPTLWSISCKPWFLSTIYQLNSKMSGCSRAWWAANRSGQG